MRPLCSVTVLFALLEAFGEAPFTHVHEYAGGEDHHSSERSHVHPRALLPESEGPVLRDIDPADDELAVTWLQAVQYSGFSLYLTPAEPALPQPSREPESLVRAPLVRGHDPPVTLRLSSRAPPLLP